MKASRIIAAAALTSTFLVGAPTAADAQSRTIDCNATEKVELLNTRIYAHTNGTDSQGKPWQSEMIWDLNPPIATGEYNAHVVSWDAYEGRASDPQDNERWFIEFLGENDEVLAQSQPTDDVPDGVDLGEIRSDIGTVSFDEPVLAVRTLHVGGGDGSAQSVLMGCLGLDLVTSNAPAEAPVDTPVDAASCTDQAGFHDVNGECVAIDVTPEPEPAPEPAAPAQCTDREGFHDVNGECVAIGAAEAEPEPAAPAECTDAPGRHDVNGECVDICTQNEDLVNGECVATRVAGNVQTAAATTTTAKPPANPAPANQAPAPQVAAAAAPQVQAAQSSSTSPQLPVTGSPAQTAAVWAIGILLAGAAMGLSAKAVRGH